MAAAFVPALGPAALAVTEFIQITMAHRDAGAAGSTCSWGHPQEWPCGRLEEGDNSPPCSSFPCVPGGPRGCGLAAKVSIQAKLRSGAGLLG